MNTCKGCREQQTADHLCLQCIEDLNSYLREIPDLYQELGSYRLPGSVTMAGPRVGMTSRLSAPAPVRLEVVDLLDRGEVMARLLKWTDETGTISGICAGFRNHLLSTAAEPWAGDFWRDMRSLCRDLGRAVGQPEELPVGKCSRPTDDQLCRGQLMRLELGGVYCRRCGDKPTMASREVWLTDRETALAVGRPLETVRTWIKRGRAGFPSPTWTAGRWSTPIGPRHPRHAWLPTAVALATVPLRSDSVNHGSRAELSSRTITGPTDSIAPIPQNSGGVDRAGASRVVDPVTADNFSGAAEAGEAAPGDHQNPGADP